MIQVPWQEIFHETLTAWKPIASICGSIILWFSGMPKVIVGKVVSYAKQKKFQRRLAAGIFDDATLRDAFAFYVRPKFSNKDPSVEVEPARALTYARDDLFNMVDRFLSTVAKRHLFILADSGMGKTSFLLNYFYRNYSGLLKPKLKLKIVSLSRSGSEDVIKSVDSSEVGDTVLLLDALDEDPDAVGRADERVKELLQLAENFKAVIVTCRTQFFRNDEAIPVKTGLVKIGAVRASSSKEYEFERAYLAPFDDKQIRSYLSRRFPGLFSYSSRKAAGRVVSKVPSLSVRPMLLAHMADILSDELVVSLPVDVYASMVGAWVRREDRWVNEDDLLRFSRGLAFDLYSRSKERGGELAEPDEVLEISKCLNVRVDLDKLTSRSLLNRNGDGRFKFSHRSIMEYFVVDALLFSRAGTGLLLTDQMTKFLLQRVCRVTDDDEHVFFDVKVLSKVIEPCTQSGYSTNFSLYEKVPRHINHEVLARSQLSVESRFGGRATFGEAFADVLSINAGRENWPSLIRVVCDGLNIDSAFTTLYLSAWTSDNLIITKFDVDTRSILAAFDSVNDLEGDFALCGVMVTNGHESTVSWTLNLRVDLDGLGRPVKNFYYNNALGMRFDRKERVLVVSLVDGFFETNNSFTPFGISASINFKKMDYPSIATLPIRGDAN